MTKLKIQPKHAIFVLKWRIKNSLTYHGKNVRLRRMTIILPKIQHENERITQQVIKRFE